MRLSFSTRGWDSHDWQELVDTAAEMGFSGIEVYDVLGHDELIERGAPFHAFNTRATVRDLKNKGLSIPVFDSSLDISIASSATGDAGKGAEKDSVEQAKALIDMAGEAGSPYVCVKAQYGTEEAVRDALDTLLPYAASRDVCILMETSGIYGDTSRLTELLDRYASDYLAALWDVHHPYR
ncbi:MAG: TIM barrel protein, partial [Atopobiaceae bacterium]|nr:TIM barrel protein [Atopobiaceae bacterium]